MNRGLFETRFDALAQRRGADHQLVAQLQAYLMTREDNGRIYPYAVAPKLNIHLDQLMPELLHGVNAGIFDLHWDIRCPHCGRLVSDYRHLEEASQSEYCQMCAVNYDVDFAANVEVTFSMNDDIYDDDAFGDVERPEGVQMLTGLDMMHYPAFRNIFRDEVLSRREQLKITAVTLLFTDITGSTQMYEKLGDTVAYNIVRDHFDILFSEIESHNGVIIKTIGDAVMASFRSNEEAVRCILNGMGRFEEYNQERDLDHQVRIKIGLHRGPAILVTLNERLDYFGSTVNKAARIQGFAQSDQILLSQEVYETAGVQQVIESENKMYIRPMSLDLKGLEGQHGVYALSRNEPEPAVSQGLFSQLRARLGLG